jgi:hypothetical protein
MTRDVGARHSDVSLALLCVRAAIVNVNAKVDGRSIRVRRLVFWCARCIMHSVARTIGLDDKAVRCCLG